ncbi:MAG: CDP-glycerol glycerophosphotransferase family protein [Longibaculum sp.]
MKKFFEKIKNVKLNDIKAIFKFIIALIPSFFYKYYLIKNNQRLWLICEEEFEARDNGYVFFKYLNKNHPEINSCYAINYHSLDYNKVKKVGKTVKYGTIKHWIYYLSATANISSQKGGKPNAAVCYLLEVYGILKNKRFFLQHGVIMNDTEFLHYNNTKMRLFVCGAFQEYNYVKEKFGYPNGYVQYLGLCRFDELHNLKTDKNKILLMPTWRNWFKLKSSSGEDIDADKRDFKNSEYYTKYQSLINNKTLIAYLEKHNINLYFYPHRNIQKHLNEFTTKSNNIHLASESDYDIQILLRETSLMITDYSSVSIDFAYMKKPLIYYQFDIEKFRKYQYEEGYFSYNDNGFGPVLSNEEEVVKRIISYCENNYEIEEVYLKRQSNFFKLYDSNNCERNYFAIKKILEEKS